MNITEINVLADLDLEIKKLEIATQSADHIHAWDDVNLGVKINQDGSSRVVSICAATAVPPNDATNGDLARAFINGKEERARVMPRADAAQHALDRARKLRVTLVKAFNERAAAAAAASDPSALDAERLVRFSQTGSMTYAVMLSSGEGSIVQAIKKRPSGGTYRSAILADSQNWKRAVRLARMAKANDPKIGVLVVEGINVYYNSARP